MQNWIESAEADMEHKGTVGDFGKYSAKKVAADKKKGGIEEKRAIFAQNMHKIAEERKK